MKTPIISLVLMCMAFPSVLIAQDYKSLFGEESTYWIFEWGNLFGSLQDTIVASNTDTLIDNMYWRKIMCKIGSDQFQGGYLREDLSTGKVWYKPIVTSAFLLGGGDTSTILAFDFSLSSGDSFAFNYMKLNQGNIITPVSHVETANLLKHIYFYAQQSHTGTNSTPNIFIEGIGSDLGIIYFNENGNSTMLFQRLICAYKDDELAYANPVFGGNCNVHPGGTSNVSKPGIFSFSVNPNPATESISIQLPANVTGYQATHIEIINHLGQSVLHQSWDNNTVSIGHLPAGMYFVNLQCDGMLFSPQKLVVY